MESQSSSNPVKSSAGSIIAATIVGVAVVGGVASSLVEAPRSEDPIKAQTIQRAINPPTTTQILDTTSATPATDADEEVFVPAQVVPAAKPSPKATAPAPKPEPACSCPISDLDCSDFDSGPDAQEVYSCCLKQGRGDYHRLDRDKDGTACDTLW